MAYYERQCSDAKKKAYIALLKGASDVESTIRVPLLASGEIEEVFSRLRLDHPEIFYLTGFHIRFRIGAEYGELVPEYLFSKDKIVMHRQAISARVERLIRDIKNRSDADKVRFIHDFIIGNVRYDKLKKPYSHEVIGPLTQGVGVCEGIAKTVKLLSDALSVECIVALSNPAEGQKYGHAWNVLKLGGRWYQLDATFDLSLSRCGVTRWDYYLLPDTQIYRDHVRPTFPVPECTDGSRSYYREQKLSFTKPEELSKRITQLAKKKRNEFVFQWRGSSLTNEAINGMISLIKNAAGDAGRFAEISINRTQAVFHVRFSDTEDSENTTFENADEENG